MNLICKCGHLEERHIWEYTMWCQDCAKPQWYPNGVPKNLFPVHHNYRPDNLKYLLGKYEEKKLSIPSR